MSGSALPGASQALVAAALGGLLFAGASLAACGGSSTTTPTSASGDDGDASPGTITSIASADGGTIATTEPTTPANGDSPIPRTECANGVYAAADRQITSSSTGTVAQDDFQTRCAAANGIYETQPNCGGSNSCRGMSYDNNTETLTEHTCRATNTCAGFSCIVCDEHS